MTDKLELKSCHEVIDTVSVADVDSIFQGEPTDPDILTVFMKGGRRLYCDEVCPVDSMQEEPVSVWHDKDKEPCEDEQVLVCLSGYCYVDFYHKEDKCFYMLGKFKHYLCEVDKWAYVDDLLNLSKVQVQRTVNSTPTTVRTGMINHDGKVVKPAESNDIKSVLLVHDEILNNLLERYKTSATFKTLIVNLKNWWNNTRIHLLSFNIEQNHAWSEEDERKLNDAIDACKAQYGNMSYTAEWLKSLKCRVQPQLKQEWSGGDEAHLHSLITHLEQWIERHPNTTGADIQGENIAWLKSLRPQNRWKPSEEQMEALVKECFAHSNYDLCRLLEDLKKL